MGDFTGRACDAPVAREFWLGGRRACRACYAFLPLGGRPGGLLVLDEFGYVPASQVGAGLLFDVIGTAYERTSVIVTTNLPFERWTEVLGDERLVGATSDRLTHRRQLLEATGEGYRLKEARRRAPEKGGAREGKDLK